MPMLSTAPLNGFARDVPYLFDDFAHGECDRCDPRHTVLAHMRRVLRQRTQHYCVISVCVNASAWASTGRDLNTMPLLFALTVIWPVTLKQKARPSSAVQPA